jgi:hypothetical protein
MVNWIPLVAVHSWTLNYLLISVWGWWSELLSSCTLYCSVWLVCNMDCRSLQRLWIFSKSRPLLHHNIAISLTRLQHHFAAPTFDSS